MHFRLYYRGNLKANSKAKDKHVLRQQFHEQLKELWNQPPLDSHRSFFESDDDDEILLVRPMGNFKFVPVVSSRLSMVADLHITLLRPEAPGNIVTQGGDIDNRLKTLLDALKVPNLPNALPQGAVPVAGESPFFCLLEDDNLITGLNVETDRLLDPSAGPNEVVLVIHVQTSLTVGTFANLGLV